MPKIIFLLPVLFSLGSLLAQKTIVYDPDAEVRSIEGFSAIIVSGGINLFLSQGDVDGIAVSANESKFRERIRTSVNGGVLKIWYDHSGFRFNSGNKNLQAYVSFRSVNKVSASGASDVFVDGNIKGEELTINLSGASDFKGGVELNKLSIGQSGASDATITGKAATLNVNASGASDLKGFELKTQHCSVKASGASDIKVSVEKELTANASGASTIYYKGAGSIIKVHSSGASNISKKS